MRAVAIAVWGGRTRATCASDGSGVWQDGAITFESESSFCTWSSRSMRYGVRERKSARWLGRLYSDAEDVSVRLFSSLAE